MKLTTLALPFVLALASTASPVNANELSPVERVEALLRLNQAQGEAIKRLQALQADTETRLKSAAELKLKDDALAQREIGKQTQRANEAENDLGYKTWKFIRHTLYWILGIGGGLYLLAFVGGLFKPTTFFYRVYEMLDGVLPFANPVRWLHKLFNRETVSVPAATVPVQTGR